MTVAELLAALQPLPPETPVLIEFVSEMGGDRYLAEPEPPELAWVDHLNERPVASAMPAHHQAVILK